MRDNLIPQKNVAPNARGRNASIVPISSFDMRIVLMSIDKHNELVSSGGFLPSTALTGWALTIVTSLNWKRFLFDVRTPNLYNAGKARSPLLLNFGLDI